jgi:hypothetical protein
MVVRVIVTTDPEEMIATEEMLQEEAKERKRKKRKGKEKKRQEQKRKEKNAELRLLRQRGRILPRGTRILRRTIRRRAMRLLPPETLQGNA